jgi:hypothetical protein
MHILAASRSNQKIEITPISKGREIETTSIAYLFSVYAMKLTITEKIPTITPMLYNSLF